MRRREEHAMPLGARLVEDRLRGRRYDEERRGALRVQHRDGLCEQLAHREEATSHEGTLTFDTELREDPGHVVVRRASCAPDEQIGDPTKRTTERAKGK
jgi:hypothetical protein